MTQRTRRFCSTRLLGACLLWTSTTTSLLHPLHVLRPDKVAFQASGNKLHLSWSSPFLKNAMSPRWGGDYASAASPLSHLKSKKITNEEDPLENTEARDNARNASALSALNQTQFTSRGATAPWHSSSKFSVSSPTEDPAMARPPDPSGLTSSLSEAPAVQSFEPESTNSVHNDEIPVQSETVHSDDSRTNSNVFATSSPAENKVANTRPDPSWFTSTPSDAPVILPASQTGEDYMYNSFDPVPPSISSFPEEPTMAANSGYDEASLDEFLDAAEPPRSNLFSTSSPSENSVANKRPDPSWFTSTPSDAPVILPATHMGDYSLDEISMTNDPSFSETSQSDDGFSTFESVANDPVDVSSTADVSQGYAERPGLNLFATSSPAESVANKPPDPSWFTSTPSDAPVILPATQTGEDYIYNSFDPVPPSVSSFPEEPTMTASSDYASLDENLNTAEPAAERPHSDLFATSSPAESVANKRPDPSWFTSTPSDAPVIPTAHMEDYTNSFDGIPMTNDPSPSGFASPETQPDFIESVANDPLGGSSTADVRTDEGYVPQSSERPGSDLFATSSPAESVATKRPDPSWFTSSPSDAPSPSAGGGEYTNSINSPVTAASRPNTNSAWGEPDPSWITSTPSDAPPPAAAVFATSSPSESGGTNRPDPSWFTSSPSDAPSPAAGGDYTNSIDQVPPGEWAAVAPESPTLDVPPSYQEDSLGDLTTFDDVEEELWETTRLGLVELEVLPPDTTDSEDDGGYAAAVELRLLREAPPLLVRLEPRIVLAAARVVLQAGFPPALLRNEPTLLTFTPAQIQRGLEELRNRYEGHHSPGLLVGIIEAFQQKEIVALQRKKEETTIRAQAAPELPVLDPALVDAARTPLSWEEADSCSSLSWESGELWAKTRLGLANLWVLPRDMSNGADERYAAEATQQELELLQLTPQLLRLEPGKVLAAAQAVLKAGFAPAVLRREPDLLALSSKQIQRGIQELGDLSEAKRTPGLLVKVIEERIKRDDNDMKQVSK